MSARMRPGARTVLRLCLFTVRSASHLVPANDRDHWRGTWDAELWYRVLQLDRRGPLTLPAGVALSTAASAPTGTPRGCSAGVWHRARCSPTLCSPRGSSALHRLRTAAAVLSLGLALGVGGTVLGVTQAARTRVAATGQERVVRLWNRAPAAQIGRTGLSALELRTFRAESPSIEALAGQRAAVVTLGTGVEATAVDAGLVSAEFFETLGVAAELGRTLARS